MSNMNFNWTARITATLALALAAGCAPSVDANPAGTFAAHSEEASETKFEESKFEGDSEEADFDGDTEDSTFDGATERPAIEEVAPPTDDGIAQGTASMTECAASPDDGDSGIADCIAAVSRTGGEVQLEAGEYLVSETVHVPSGVSIVGAGPETVLVLDSEVNAPVIAIGSFDEDPREAVTGATVRDLSIYGSRGDQTEDSLANAPWVPVAGIAVRRGEDIQISSVSISGTASSGVVVDAGSQRVVLSDVAVFEAGFDGVTVQASARIRIEKSTLRGNDGSGASFDWGVMDSEVISSTIADNGKRWGGGDNPGIYMAMTANMSVTANVITRNDGNGVVLTNQGMAEDPATTCSSDNIFRGNEVSDNGQFGFWLTHASCEGNRSIDNANLRNAWGPVFEPVCGQLETVAGTCEGAGCNVTCGD